MMKIQVLLYLTFAFLFFPGAHSATISFTNKCTFKVWPATLTSDNKPQLASTGFELAPQASNSIDTPVPWNGRFWGRTNCFTDNSGMFTCDKPGDCASGQVSCNGKGGIPPATLVEINIPAGGGQDFYDVSLVDGFNLPISITPQGGHAPGDCRSSSCSANVNAMCPSELQVTGAGGSVVGCMSACLKFNEPKYCCTPPNEKPETCPPTDYSMKFSQQCPEAYSYAYDDKKGTFTCSGGPNYAITFCP
ncbi:putative glucan endo-1,3-beta-D-glucosidase [Rosa chinensis]|uniref:Putative glucan endo-1,3-beta-D-glucosidase n=2 Tax=Rosa chinensis TaxID=74649 RepID=A0A2P6REM4_ROSCH|nr:glucan endo-1,3-beta-glucosidase [Rosa chinensis]PRQ44877.1 putative glucan endo-1,3-beta-D-glucosidase [Rosa chinensis]